MGTPTYRALLIANSTFPEDAHNLPDLEGPRNDAALLRDALCDDRYGLFPSDNVRLVVERTMSDVLGELDGFLQGASRRDTLLLYYSGHGLLDLSGELYLCVRDTRTDRRRSTAVKASDVDGMLQESAAGTTIIVLDCCHSGAFKGGELAHAFAGRGRFVVTSCRTGELANDAHALNKASMFTHHLVEGLLGGAPDGDGDGIVGLDDLYTYVHGRLVAERRQIPQRSFAGSGEVPVARRPVAGAAGAADMAGVAGDVVDPAAADPVLDLSETVVDLGQVEVGEPLPAERIAVVNRGGGELAWHADCTADWVTVERDRNELVLHLRPAAGVNRANVHVRDERTGAVKTVRVVVRATAPTPAPAPAARAPAASPVPSARAWAPIPSTASHPRRRWFAAAMVATAVAGLVLTATGMGFLGDVEHHSGEGAFLRHRDFGPGLGLSILGGACLVLLPLVAAWTKLVGGTIPTRRRRFVLAAGLGLAGPLGIERAGMHFAWEPAEFYPGWEVSFGALPVVLCLVAAVLCCVGLREDGAIGRPWPWVASWVVPVAAGAAVLWGIGCTVPIYDAQAATRSWVDATNGGQVGALVALLVAALVTAVVVAFTQLYADAGRGLVAGAAGFVALVEIVEVATLVASPGHRQGFGIVWMLLPAAALVATTTHTLLQPPSLGPQTRPRPARAPA